MVVIIQTKDTDCQIGLKKKYNLLIASTKCTSLAIIDPVLGCKDRKWYFKQREAESKWIISALIFNNIYFKPKLPRRDK